MERVGFDPMRGEGVFTMRLERDLLGWSGHMTTRTKDGAFEVFPKVGVRHEAIHRIADRLRDRAEDSAPTISTALGYLMPEGTANRIWRLDDEARVAEQAEDMADAIVEYGCPYMRAHVSLESLIAELEQSVPWEYSQIRIPVALVLSDRAGDARSFVGRE